MVSSDNGVRRKPHKATICCRILAPLSSFVLSFFYFLSVSCTEVIKFSFMSSVAMSQTLFWNSRILKIKYVMQQT